MRTDTDAPGLAWRTRAGGVKVPYWIASKEAVRAGYPTHTVNLSCYEADSIVARCERLQAEMIMWLRGLTRGPVYDGTLASLLDLYRGHPESSYRKLKPSALLPYNCYLSRIEREHGGVKLKNLSGLEIKGWHKLWRAPDEDGGPEKLGAATMAMAVLKAAMAWGVVTGIPGCAEECTRLRKAMALLRLPTPKPRSFAPTAAEVERVRAEAHKLGHPRAALAYALQFETMQRQYDIVGQWVSIDDPRPAAIIKGREKWLGPTWAAIDENLTLTIRPGKTERTTGAKVHVNLRGCPMVMDELARVPEAERVGPIITHDGAPYAADTFQWVWRKVREAAGLPEGMWNRDLRAGGVTEAQIAGASSEDRAKLAGHSKKVNERVYARDRLAASSRVVALRANLREGKLSGILVEELNASSNE
jgi:hypothetical protein